MKSSTRFFEKAGTDCNILFLIGTARSEMSPRAHVFTNVEIFHERSGIAVRAEEGLAADDVALVSKLLLQKIVTDARFGRQNFKYPSV